MAKVKVETLCSKCRKPLPTKRVTEKRLSRTLEYPILDEAKLNNTQGRWQHKECAL
jgi:hypothetical protein